jgi:calnexin
MMWATLITTTVVICAAVSPVNAAGNIFFQETFDDLDPFASGKWSKSGDDKYADQPVMIKGSDRAVAGWENDKGLSLTQEMKFYGIASQFPEALDTKGKDFVVQYELKLEEGLNCGGAYVKLPRAADSGNLSEMNNETPYTIMFGPDRCGSGNDKVHFIMQHQNPISHEWEEKHFNDPATVFVDVSTHLYVFCSMCFLPFLVFEFNSRFITACLHSLTHMARV